MAEYAATEKKERTAGEKRDFVANARKQLQVAIDAFGESRKDQLDDVRFAAATPDNMWQWPDAVKNARLNDSNGARPVLTINKLPPHIRLITNEMRKNRPSPHVVPVDDKADPETADMLEGMLRHIESRSDADVAYDAGSQNQVEHGEGFVRVLTDYTPDSDTEQEILIAPIRNSFVVYMDPDGLRRDPTGRYCEWAFITDRVKKTEFKKECPEATMSSWGDLAPGDESQGWIDDEYVTIAEYFCVEYEGRTRKVKWFKLSPLEILEERDWAGKYIPIARMVGNEWEVDGKLVISGIVRNAKDACRMYNYNASAEVEQVSLAPKAPWVGAVGQFNTHSAEWARANVENHSRLEYDPVDANGALLPPPFRPQPAIAPGGIISAKLAAADDIQATIGQYNPSLGADAKEKTGRAIIARQQQADLGTYHYLDNAAKCVRHVGRICLDLVPPIYDTKRIARILGEDGTASTVTIDPSIDRSMVEVNDGDKIRKVFNPGVGVYDIRVTTGPSYTTQRQETAQMLVEMSQGTADPMIALVMRYLALKNMDWSGAQDLAETLKKMLPPQLQEEGDEDGEQKIPPEVEGQMKQLMAQVANAAGQLEAAKMAVQERDQKIQQLESQNAQAESTAKQVDAERKVEEARIRLQTAQVNQVADEAKARATIATAEASIRSAEITAAQATQSAQETAKTQADSSGQSMQLVAATLQDAFAMLSEKMDALAVQIANTRKSVVIEAPSGVYRATVSPDAPVRMQ